MAILINPIIPRLLSRLPCQEEASLFPGTELPPLVLVKGTNSPADVLSGRSSWSGAEGWLSQQKAGIEEPGAPAAPPQPASEPREHTEPRHDHSPCPHGFFVPESGHRDSA